MEARECGWRHLWRTWKWPERSAATVARSGHARFLVGGGAEILMSDGNVMRWDLGSQHVDESSGQTAAPATKRRKRRHPEPWRTKHASRLGRHSERRTVPRPRAVVEAKSPEGDGSLNEDMYRFLVEEPAVAVKVATDTLVHIARRDRG